MYFASYLAVVEQVGGCLLGRLPADLLDVPGLHRLVLQPDQGHGDGDRHSRGRLHITINQATPPQWDRSAYGRRPPSRWSVNIIFVHIIGMLGTLVFYGKQTRWRRSAVERAGCSGGQPGVDAAAAGACTGLRWRRNISLTHLTAAAAPPAARGSVRSRQVRAGREGVGPSADEQRVEQRGGGKVSNAEVAADEVLAVAKLPHRGDRAQQAPCRDSSRPPRRRWRGSATR